MRTECLHFDYGLTQVWYMVYIKFIVVIDLGQLELMIQRSTVLIL